MSDIKNNTTHRKYLLDILSKGLYNKFRVKRNTVKWRDLGEADRSSWELEADRLLREIRTSHLGYGFCNSPEGCYNYSGLESDLKSLIEVCKKGDMVKINKFLYMNYPN